MTALHPHTCARRVRLRPASAADGATFYRTLLAAGVESLPPPDRIAEDFASVTALFLIERRADGETIGYSTLHNRGRAGHLEAGLYTDTSRARHGLGGEATVLTINYGFATYPIDKMIVRTTEASFDGIADAFDAEGAEGALRDHLYFRGRTWDLHAFAFGRAEWLEYMRHVEPVIIRPRIRNTLEDRIREGWISPDAVE